MKPILKTVALLFVLVVSSSRAQIETEEGDEICSCSPTVFRFTMNFAGTCPGNLDVGDGIANNDCQTLVLGPDQGDTSPVIIDTLTILELNDNEVINSTTVTGPFADGDAIVYASISSYRNLTEFYFPVGLEMTLTGENENQETIVNIVSIRYDTSECGVWPVIPPDTMIGWVDFVSQISVKVTLLWVCLFYLQSHICFCRRRSRMPCDSTVLRLRQRQPFHQQRLPLRLLFQRLLRQLPRQA